MSVLISLGRFTVEMQSRNQVGEVNSDHGILKSIIKQVRAGKLRVY